MRTGSKSISGQVKATRRRLKMLMIVMACFLAWAGTRLLDQFQDVQAKASQLAALEQKLEATKQANESFRLQIIRLNDPEYIEQLLRKELHMTKEGETLYVETE